MSHAAIGQMRIVFFSQTGLSSFKLLLVVNNIDSVRKPCLVGESSLF
jgi:hypothetical protein